jgi:hypothetical protein
MSDISQVREMVIRGVGLYDGLLMQAGNVVDGNGDWNEVRRAALHMASGLARIVNLIKTHANKALVRLSSVLLANVVSFAAARRPEEVEFKRLTRAEDLARLVQVA